VTTPRAPASEPAGSAASRLASHARPGLDDPQSPVARPAEPIPSERALELILEGTRPLPPRSASLEEADGRAAAHDVLAPRRLPAWDNSAKDGYAVRRQDLRSPEEGGRGVTLPVTGEIAAGDAPGARLDQGTTVRIMTGAPLPEGADAVVPVEDTESSAGGSRFADVGQSVTILRLPARDANVRPAGADVQAGTRVLEEGETVTPGRLALLAALGEARVEVHRRPRVTLIPTGDELVEPGHELPPGKLFSSNSHGLAALVRRAGGVPTLTPIVPDDRLRIREAVFHALEASDVVVTSGGVSAGRHDHVRGVIEEAAGGLVFWRVRMRPGEPLVFARTSDLAGVGRVSTRYLFGLPGNPTSATVTFLEFVRPLLRRLAGFRDIYLPTVPATLGEPVRTEAGRRSFVRVRLSRDEAGGFVAIPSGGQGSGLLRPLALADGLLLAGPERTDLPAGERVVVQLLDLPAAPREPFAL
jgi:molybdenum cofactor synthesis domain-containing protein